MIEIVESCKSNQLSRRFEHRKFWNGYYELASPLADERHLIHDLTLQIPRKNKYIIRFSFLDFIRMINRDQCARQIIPLLMRAAVDRIVDEILAHTAIIQQRVSFSRRTVPGNRFSVALCIDEKLQNLPLRLLDPLLKIIVVTQRSHSF